MTLFEIGKLIKVFYDDRGSTRFYQGILSTEDKDFIMIKDRKLGLITLNKKFIIRVEFVEPSWGKDEVVTGDKN